jgi:sec-independent protein translocase protein TatB
MFDFSFAELAIIGGVALVVLGPEKLPRVARTAGQWAAKAQRYVADVKADIQREGELAELKKLQDSVQQSARELESSMHENLRSIEAEIGKTPLADDGAPSVYNDAPGPTEDFRSIGEFVKPPPTVEALAERLEALQRRLDTGAAGFKYAPRARAARARPAARLRRASFQ